MTDVTPDQPRTLKCPGEQERRRNSLDAPHIIELTDFAQKLRRDGFEVPYFDPLDGGIHAKILFLFEKPGRMADPKQGSGFISRNNDDATAEAVFRFMEQAGIDRKLTVIWNAIPGWNGTIKIVKGELEEGRKALAALFALLHELRVVVLVGRKGRKVSLRNRKSWISGRCFNSSVAQGAGYL